MSLKKHKKKPFDLNPELDEEEMTYLEGMISGLVMLIAAITGLVITLILLK